MVHFLTCSTHKSPSELWKCGLQHACAATCEMCNYGGISLIGNVALIILMLLLWFIFQANSNEVEPCLGATPSDKDCYFFERAPEQCLVCSDRSHHLVCFELFLRLQVPFSLGLLFENKCMYVRIGLRWICFGLGQRFWTCEELRCETTV